MSDVMLIGILRMPLNLVFPSEPDAVMAFQIHARMGEAADRIEADEKKITRLLAVEVAAKEMAKGGIYTDPENSICAFCGVDINYKSHTPTCPVLVVEGESNA